VDNPISESMITLVKVELAVLCAEVINSSPVEHKLPVLYRF